MGKFNLTKFVKNAIFEDAGDETKKPEEEKSRAKIVQTPAAPAITPKVDVAVETTSDDDGKIDPKILETLEEKLSQENIPGPDYLELKAAAEADEAIKTEPDERKRYRQAFASMKLFFPDAGVDENRIYNSIDHYKGVLEAEEKDATDEFNRKIEEQVLAPRREISTEEEALRRKQEELDQAWAKLETKKAAIDKRERALTEKRKDFSATIGALKAAIDADLKKIKEYFKN